MEQELMQYIFGDLYILIPVLYVLGIIMKSTPSIPDWLIPWNLLAVSIVLTLWMLGPSVQSVIQAVLVTGATVLAHQLVKQTRERK